MNDRDLVKIAIEAMQKSYSPYSNFKVGAALLTKQGKVYTGCNIENAAYGPTNCAERTAFFKAISEGEKEFSKIAIVGGKDGNITNLFMPCGVCRQVCPSNKKGEETKITTGEIPFTFSTFGTNGTKYTLVMAPNTTQISTFPHSDINPNPNLTLELSLRDADNKLIPFLTVGFISKLSF